MAYNYITQYDSPVLLAGRATASVVLLFTGGVIRPEPNEGVTAWLCNPAKAE